MIQSDAIEIAEKILKHSVWCCSKQNFGDAERILENKNAKWYILTLCKPISVRITKDTSVTYAMDWTNRQWKV